MGVWMILMCLTNNKIDINLNGFCSFENSFQYFANIWSNYIIRGMLTMRFCGYLIIMKERVINSHYLFVGFERMFVKPSKMYSSSESLLLFREIITFINLNTQTKTFWTFSYQPWLCKSLPMSLRSSSLWHFGMWTKAFRLPKAQSTLSSFNNKSRFDSDEDGDIHINLDLAEAEGYSNCFIQTFRNEETNMFRHAPFRITLISYDYRPIDPLPYLHSSSHHLQLFDLPPKYFSPLPPAYARCTISFNIPLPEHELQHLPFPESVDAKGGQATERGSQWNWWRSPSWR